VAGRPKTRGAKKGLYARGDFWLDWDRKANGDLRSPYLTIFWYDSARGRNRSASTGTVDDEAARKALDAKYLEETQGVAVCPTCGHVSQRGQGFLVATAISNYLLLVGDKRESKEAIRARLAHVVNYLGTLAKPNVACEDVDESWIEQFRAWMARQPILFENGGQRARAQSTIENSVIQLAAAINLAFSRHDTTQRAQFRPIPTRDVNVVPTHRSDIKELAAMFNFALARNREFTPDDQIRVAKARVPLLRFLRFSVATVARPDAVYDFSTDPERKQWNASRAVIALNPKGRRQTKKYRAIVRCPHQLVDEIKTVAKTKGPYVTVGSIRKSWEGMATALNLPGEGESGQKLIRRSIAQLLRDPARGVPTDQLEVQMGHRPISSTTDIYAPFDPAYLDKCLAGIEGIIDEIEAIVPGAFHRSDTGDAANVLKLRSA